MIMVDVTGLEAFVVRAKSATYVGSGSPAEPSRLGSHDLVFDADGWLYRNSYFGGTDFVGQETVWFRDEPVWAENYLRLHLAAGFDRRGSSRLDD
jgi:hypothetical protein